MVIISGILDDTWISPDNSDGIRNVIKALRPLMTSELALQINSYLNNPQGNAVYKQALTEQFKDALAAYAAVRALYSEDVIEMLDGVGYQYVYLTYKAGTSKAGIPVDQIRKACESVTDVDTGAITDAITISLDDIDNYIAVLMAASGGDVRIAHMVSANAHIFKKGEYNNPLKRLKSRAESTRRVAKSLDYMKMLGITPSENISEASSVFNFIDPAAT